MAGLIGEDMKAPRDFWPAERMDLPGNYHIVLDMKPRDWKLQISDASRNQLISSLSAAVVLARPAVHPDMADDLARKFERYVLTTAGDMGIYLQAFQKKMLQLDGLVDRRGARGRAGLDCGGNAGWKGALSQAEKDGFIKEMVSELRAFRSDVDEVRAVSIATAVERAVQDGAGDKAGYQASMRLKIRQIREAGEARLQRERWMPQKKHQREEPPASSPGHQNPGKEQGLQNQQSAQQPAKQEQSPVPNQGGLLDTQERQMPDVAANHDLNSQIEKTSHRLGALSLSQQPLTHNKVPKSPVRGVGQKDGPFWPNPALQQYMQAIHHAPVNRNVEVRVPTQQEMIQDAERQVAQQHAALSPTQRAFILEQREQRRARYRQANGCYGVCRANRKQAGT